MIANADTPNRAGIAASRAITLRDVCRFLFRHKKKLLFTFLATTTVIAGIIVFWPRTYASEAKLFVRVGRESVALDPTATVGETIPINTTREVEIKSILDVLRSRVMLEKVVDAVGPDAILRDQAGGAAEPDASPAKSISLANWIPELDPISRRERAVLKLAPATEFWFEPKSNVITVQSKAATPELAQTIVATLVDSYLGEHARLNRTPGSYAFFVGQAELLRERFSKALKDLRDVKNELGLVSVESQQKILQDEITATETGHARAQAALAAARARAGALGERVAALPERVMTDEVVGYPNVAADEMRTRLYDLESRKAELAAQYTATHPARVVAERQLVEAREIVDRQAPRRTQSTTTMSATRQQLQLSLFSEESNASSLAAEVNAMEKQLAALRVRSRQLNEQEVRIAQLERQVELCRSNYKTSCEKLEQSRINEALQSDRITNVNVLQAANCLALPISPNKAAVAILGLLLAGSLSLGVALAAEYCDCSLKTPAEVERSLALPVLMSIPRVSRRHVVLK
ncbi:MAG: hypothetical protein ABR915_05280 [Thermoguttaceae bacterium]